MIDPGCHSYCGPMLHWRDTHKEHMKKISDDVYLINGSTVVHDCGPREPSFLITMGHKETKNGILYTCKPCYYTLDEGVSMAIRLNEADI